MPRFFARQKNVYQKTKFTSFRLKIHENLEKQVKIMEMLKS